MVKLQDDLQSATETIASLKKEGDDMVTKLRKESNRMAAELRKESDDKAAELRRRSDGIAVQLRKESDDKAAELRRRSDGIAVQLRKESDDKAAELRRSAVRLRREIEDMAAELRRESTESRRESENELSRKGFLILLCICFLLSSLYLYNEKNLTEFKIRTMNNEKGVNDVAVKLNDVAAKLNNVVVKLNMVITQQKEYKTLTKKTFKIEKANKFFSRSFYTGIDGYNMCIDVYPNGNGEGKGTHVSVFIHILKGDNDDNLKWPFIGTVKVELLNQLEDNNHHLETLTFNQEHNIRVRSNKTIPTFIPHSQLDNYTFRNIQYLKDDILYFRVSVEVSGPKPWLECTLK